MAAKNPPPCCDGTTTTEEATSVAEAPSVYRSSSTKLRAVQPDEPVILRENISFNSRTAGIGARNEYAGEAYGFVMDDTYVEIMREIFASPLAQSA